MGAAAVPTKPAARSTAPRCARLLDGEHAEIRDRVREWLCEPGNAPRPTCRWRSTAQQVLDWAQRARLAGRHRASAIPSSTAARTTSARRRRRSRRSRFGDLSLLVKCGVQFGLFGGAVLHLGTERHHERYLRDIAALRAARLLRDDRDRPRLQRPGAAARPRPTTRRPASSSSTRPTTTRARTTSATPRATAGMAVVFAQLDRRRRGARRARAARADPRRATATSLARHPDRGLRRQARPQRRRQRPHLVRPRARPAREPARPLRAGRARRRRTTSPIENPTKRFFTMLGTLIQGRDQRLRRVDQRDQGRARRSPSGTRCSRRQFGPPGRARRRC